MLGLNPIGIAIAAGALVTSAGAGFFAGHNNGYASAMKENRKEITRNWIRELSLWSLVNDTNVAKSDLLEDVDRWMAATGKARKRAEEAIRAEREKVRKAEAEANAAIQDLLYAAQSSQWAGQPVDPVFVCRMRGDADNCSDPARGSDSETDMGVREPTTGEDG